MDWQGLLDLVRQHIQPVGIIIDVLVALIVVVVGLAIARSVKGRIVRLVARRQRTGNLAVLLGNTTFLGGIVLIAVIVMTIFGVSGTAIFAVFGAGTVAIGLALQDMLKNLFAGVYLLLEQPFRIGDTIVVDNREGEVESIEVRTTVLRMRDGTQAIVPNAVVLATTVMNRSAYAARRLAVRVKGLEDDLETITRQTLAALRDHPEIVATPEPKVHVEAIIQGKRTVLVEAWRRLDHDMAPGLLVTLQRVFPDADVELVP